MSVIHIKLKMHQKIRWVYKFLDRSVDLTKEAATLCSIGQM